LVVFKKICSTANNISTSYRRRLSGHIVTQGKKQIARFINKKLLVVSKVGLKMIILHDN